MKERKIWKNTLVTLLCIQVLVALSLAVLAVTNFTLLLNQFGVKYQLDMGILQMIMTYNLVLSASICALCIFWIRTNNIAGIQGAIIVGLLIFIVSLMVFITFDRVDVLLFDSIRALLMIIVGLVIYQAQVKATIT